MKCFPTLNLFQLISHEQPLLLIHPAMYFSVEITSYTELLAFCAPSILVNLFFWKVKFGGVATQKKFSEITMFCWIGLLCKSFFIVKSKNDDE